MSDPKPSLPGDLPAAERVRRLARAGHAGGYAASRIYAGQLAVIGETPDGDRLRQEKAEQDAGLAVAARTIGDGRIRPTALLPVLNAAGFALGALTASLGPRIAANCTAAVRDAIEEHRGGGDATRTGRRGPLSAAIKAGCRLSLAVVERL